MTVVNEPDLDVLIRRSRDGDRVAFDAIAERFRPWLERVAARYAPDDGPDLVQAALLKAYTGLARYDEKFSFATWLFHILRNACFNHRRRARPVPLPPPASPGPDAIAADRELAARIEGLVAKLPAPERDIVRLRFAEGQAHRDIANQLGLTEINVRVKLYRALQRLRDGLGDVL